jgi:hypothetical protein
VACLRVGEGFQKVQGLRGAKHAFPFKVRDYLGVLEVSQLMDVRGNKGGFKIHNFVQHVERLDLIV